MCYIVMRCNVLLHKVKGNVLRGWPIDAVWLGKNLPGIK